METQNSTPESSKKLNIFQKAKESISKFIKDKHEEALLAKNPNLHSDRQLLAEIPDIIDDHEIQNEEDLVSYCKVVHQSMGDFMQEQFKTFLNLKIKLPKLVITDELNIKSECWDVARDLWPFYCPADMTTYISPVSVLQIIKQTGMKWDLVVAHIIWHEFGHHVQKVIKDNLERYLEALWKQNNKIYNVEQIKDALAMMYYEWENEESLKHKRLIQVQTELWADYLSWVYIKHEHDLWHLEESDIFEAANASYRTWDDFLADLAGKLIDKVHYTHGESQQRADAFMQWIEQWTLFNSPMKKLFDLYSVPRN